MPYPPAASAPTAVAIFRPVLILSRKPSLNSCSEKPSTNSFGSNCNSSQRANSTDSRSSVYSSTETCGSFMCVMVSFSERYFVLSNLMAFFLLWCSELLFASAWMCFRAFCSSCAVFTLYCANFVAFLWSFGTSISFIARRPFLIGSRQ